MSVYSRHYNTKKTDQMTEVPGKSQVENNEGGFVFQITPKQQFERFLILGSEGGSYYASEKKLTIENAKNAIQFIQSNGEEALELIKEISEAGRAPKADSVLFALALCCAYGTPETKNSAYRNVSSLCRTGTQLFTFLECVQALRGWSRGLRRSVSSWYTGKEHHKLEYQLLKYRQRNGWTHRDALRLSHAKPTEKLKDLLKYAAGRWTEKDSWPSEKIEAFEVVQTMTNPKDIALFVHDYQLTWEMLPTQALTHKEVWEALLEKMPMTAMIRNLAKMTSIGLIDSMSEASRKVKMRLLDAELLKKARIHPIVLLNALRTYSKGKGMRGKLTWSPVAEVVDALNDSFYLAFGAVEPTGKDIMLALDVSGSMGGSQISGMNLTAREAVAAMALVTAAVEPNVQICGFTGGFVPLSISKRQRLDDVINYMEGLPFDTTDCSVPIAYAWKKQKNFDSFVIYTDSETYAGNIHPFQALQHYRKDLVPSAKLCVVGTTASNFSIADPSDRGMMDCVGFDTATPNLISNFISEKL